MVLILNDISVDAGSEDKLKETALKLVVCVKTKWLASELKHKVYTDGITNKLIGFWSESRDNQVLVRVYGEKTELFIDREVESKNIQFLHKYKIGPELFATFKNGLCYEFIPGRPLNKEDVRVPEIRSEICKEMAKLHNIPSEAKESFLFKKVTQFIDLLPDKFPEDKESRLQPEGVSKTFLKEELEALVPVLSSLDCPLGFTHNDLLLNNILWNAENKSAHFIDFEYAATNYLPFDIANHFCEFVGVDVDLDYEKYYPDVGFQKDWLRDYLSFFLETSRSEVSDDFVEKWLGWVEKFALASHLFWASWGLLQACHSSIDFDFAGYSLLRIREYRKRKLEVLGL